MALELDRLTHLEARLAIEDLNTDFCHYLDHGEVEKLISLFTVDASYSHDTRLSVGATQIRQLFAKRANAGVRTARHMYSGLKVNLVNSTVATGHSVCMTFANNSRPPISPAIPFLVADFSDEYVREPGGRWLIAKRHIERIFVDPENSGPIGQTTRR